MGLWGDTIAILRGGKDRAQTWTWMEVHTHSIFQLEVDIIFASIAGWYVYEGMSYSEYDTNTLKYSLEETYIIAVIAVFNDKELKQDK